MRATLTADGTLRVTPETEVEAYALAAWNASRARRKGRGTLAVETTVPEDWTVQFAPATAGTYRIGNRTFAYDGTPVIGTTNHTLDATSGSTGTCP